MSLASRAAVLAELGARPAEASELLARNQNPFSLPEPGALSLPLADEPFVAAWMEYAAEAAERGVIPVLRERLPQLRFPVAEGTSGTRAYLDATRRGLPPPAGTPELVLERPDEVRLFLHATPAGRVPVLLFPHRPDFVAAVRALARRNEPAPVPRGQGALMVAGYNNWDRLARVRAAFERGELDTGGARTWAEAFPAIRARRELYQDAFVLLSAGPYSGVAASEVGVAEEAWAGLSLTLRLEHECAHYFTRRVLGAMGRSVLDELIADYAGISAAAGRFVGDWFLRFMGLEARAGYRAGGRLECYLGDPPLSREAFRVLQELLRRAARAVEAAEGGPSGAAGRTRMILALAAFTLEELAAAGAEERLRARVEAA